MRVSSLKTMAGLMVLLVAATAGGVHAQQVASGPAAASQDAPAIVNNVVGPESSRHAGRPRGARGPTGPAGPPGPSGTSTVQVVADCASCAAGDGRGAGNAALGPIAGALIAGLFGLLGLIIAKENKTSEFRQSWIDALRSDIANFTASARSFAYYDSARREEADLLRKLEYEKILVDVHQRLVQAQMTIRLRVDPHGPDRSMKKLNDSLLTSIDEISASLNKAEFESAKTQLGTLHGLAAPILKAEWQRVKRGETPYVVAKIGALVLIVVALIALGWVAATGM